MRCAREFLRAALLKNHESTFTHHSAQAATVADGHPAGTADDGLPPLRAVGHRVRAGRATEADGKHQD
jgi:hypothetical protein